MGGSLTHGSGLKQKLAAILAADVAGYSRLMGLDEAGTVADLDAARSVFKLQIESNQGRVIDMAGDSVLAVFETATGAMAAAIAVQAELRARSASSPESNRMQFRIGIHLGDVMEKADGSVYGDGVNIAARLQALAKPGGITVSDAVHGAVRGRSSVAFVDKGVQSVKNIAHPVRAYEIADPALDGSNRTVGVRNRSTRLKVGYVIAGVAFVAAAIAGALMWQGNVLRWKSTAVAPYSAADRRMTFAVIPLSAPRGDLESKAFADEVTEAFTDRQADSPWSARVVARGSVEEALRHHTSARELGDALGVHFLLRGTVTRVGSGYTVDASIVDADADQVLGTREFTWPRGKPVHGYSPVIDNTVGGLAYLGFKKVELPVSQKKPRAELDVRDLSYLAFDVWANDKATYDIAMPLLRRALRQSPNDRLALMLMVRVNLCECRNSWAQHPEEQQAIGTEALDRYLVNYPNDKRMTLEKAGLFGLQGKHEDALVLIDRLLQKSADDPDLLSAKSYYLFKLGRMEEALKLSLAARRQEPSASVDGFIATLQYSLGNYVEASTLARKAAAQMSKSQLAHPATGGVRLVQAAAEADLGHADKAKAALVDFDAAVPNMRSVSAIRKWLGVHSDLAGNEAFFADLRRAGLRE